MSIELKPKYFKTAEECEAYKQGFADFCTKLTAELHTKGASGASLFFGTKQVKQVPFQTALFAVKSAPEPPKDGGGFIAAIQSHTNHIFGKNGDNKKGNSFLDLFKKAGK